jgi:hypothetical protein
MVKLLGPFVFVAGASAATFREHDAVERGNQYALSFGTFLAASPEASLRLVLQQVHVREVRIDGRRLPGSDRLGADVHHRVFGDSRPAPAFRRGW